MAKNQGVDDPALPLGIGVIIEFIGGVLIVVPGPDAAWWIGVIGCSIGSLFVLTGVIALGVAIGIRSARD